MILFNETINPISFSYSKKNVTTVVFDNGTIRKRNEVEGYTEVSVSFLMDMSELSYFKYFYEFEINNGKDTFEAYWDTNISKYTIISDINYKNSFDTIKEYIVSFVVSYQSTECDIYRKQLLLDINSEISILSDIDPNFVNYKGCDNNRQIMNFLVDKEIEILSLLSFESGQYYFSEGLVIVDEIIPTDCDLVLDDLVSSIEIELLSLESTSSTALNVANVDFETIIKKIGNETKKHREVMTL